MAKQVKKNTQKYIVLCSDMGRSPQVWDEEFLTVEGAMEAINNVVKEDPEHYDDGITWFKIAAITDEVITVKLSKDFTLEINKENN